MKSERRREEGMGGAMWLPVNNLVIDFF
jgi:hypothetical protein